MIQIIFIILLGLTSQAKDKQVKFPQKPTNIKSHQRAIFVDSKYEVIDFVKVKDVLVSKNCAEKKNCEALKTLDTKKEVPPAPHPAMQHPAAQYCSAFGGHNFVAINSKGSEENFCGFPDKTYINSWDLYYKHYPRNESK